MRIYEFSKKIGISNKEIISKLNEAGFEVQSHMTLLSPQALAFLEEKYFPKKITEKEKSAVIDGAASQDRSVSTKKVASVRDKGILEKPAPEQQDVLLNGGLSKIFVLEAMSVGDFAKKANQSTSDVILALLHQGIIAPKNQLLSKEIVARLAQNFGIEVVEPQKEIQEIVKKVKPQVVQEGLEERLPVVVVVGHVDHGKTTLLDFIRKTRLAAKEKGGITQHIGAYEAQTAHGNIVFLDTPGHETFSLMRARGINVADIAVLVVAADDGVMPQTVEAIKLIQRYELPVIVAINKIDKASPQQIEAVKTRLASYDLIPEEWGGQIVMVPISAKTGMGVDNLLEVIVLHAKLMELAASLSAPVRGFILEAKMEKGRGYVATVLCQQGTLHVGDYFVCGSLKGRVSSLIDSFGKRIDRAYPSQPVRVAGFDALPHVGELFEVVEEDVARSHVSAEVGKPLIIRRSAQTNAFNIIVKTDSVSSQEALVGALEKLKTKDTRHITIVHAEVGAVKESDINLAYDTQSFVYGLHVKVEPNALSLAQRLGVTIKLFDVIYKLLEDIGLVLEKGKPVKMVSKKIGEAIVLKVFDIKNIGIVAGAQVKTGRLVKDAKVLIWRGKYKVGEGSITSLQRDKKTVKEVHTGFECAFMVDKFIDWAVDDRVECYLETPEI